ncbi:MAG: hypothetical protein CM15mP74_17740 [Halieaceae bacterium]|nr:MAG: hypothetical protein CM15mP74_17740 [Halieaceae bacterium]
MLRVLYCFEGVLGQGPQRAEQTVISHSEIQMTLLVMMPIYRSLGPFPRSPTAPRQENTALSAFKNAAMMATGSCVRFDLHCFSRVLGVKNPAEAGFGEDIA